MRIDPERLRVRVEEAAKELEAERAAQRVLLKLLDRGAEVSDEHLRAMLRAASRGGRR